MNWMIEVLLETVSLFLCIVLPLLICAAIREIHKKQKQHIVKQELNCQTEEKSKAA